MILTRKNYPMKSDVREKKDAYILEVDLPGFQKEDIKAYVKDGYLVLSASQDKEETKGAGKYLREERCSGALTRSFYIGQDVRQEDIKASYRHGVLKIIIPKVNPGDISKKGTIEIA